MTVVRLVLVAGTFLVKLISSQLCASCCYKLIAVELDLSCPLSGTIVPDLSLR